MPQHSKYVPVKTIVLITLLLIFAGHIKAEPTQLNAPCLKMAWLVNGKKDRATWLSISLNKAGKNFYGTAVEISDASLSSKDPDGDPITFNIDSFDSARGTLTQINFGETSFRFTIHYDPADAGIVFEGNETDLAKRHWDIVAAGALGQLTLSGSSRFGAVGNVLGDHIGLTTDWDKAYSK